MNKQRGPKLGSHRKKELGNEPKLPAYKDEGCAFATKYLKEQSHCLTCLFVKCRDDLMDEPNIPHRSRLELLGIRTED